MKTKLPVEHPNNRIRAYDKKVAAWWSEVRKLANQHPRIEEMQGYFSHEDLRGSQISEVHDAFDSGMSPKEFVRETFANL